MEVVYRKSTARKRVLPKRHKPRPLNFEAYANHGNRFIHEVALELGATRDYAARITRAVLHAIRDRLPAAEAVQFAQGLPMALKGVFFDGYDLARVPIRVRTRRAFIEFVRRNAGVSAPVDFPDPESVEQALQAVFYVLDRHMSYGQVRQVKNAMNLSVVEMINED